MKRHLLPFLLLWVVGFGSISKAAQPRLPAEVFQALDRPTAVTLYSIDPDAHFHWWFSRWFRGYRVLGQLAVRDPGLRLRVADDIKRSALTPDGDTTCVFFPRHAVHLASGSKTYDFLICFECSQMEVYSGDALISELSIGGSSKLLNGIFRAEHIRMAR